MNKKIAIIIINYNTYELTIDCVNSIIENCTIRNKIFIIDNCSVNNSYEELCDYYEMNENVLIIKSKTNNGYSAGLNVGIYAASKDKFDYYIFANNDLYISKNTIEELIDTYTKYPEAGVVGGKIVGTDNKIQKSYKYLTTFKSHILSVKPFYYLTKLLSRDESYKYDKPLVFNGMVAGCFFVIASEKVALLGLFDENVFLYYEEDILAWKMYNLSIKCVLNPMAKIIHLGSQTIPINAFSYFHRYRSALYMLKKYAKASNIELSLVYHIYRVSLLSKGLFDKKFIEKYKELKKYYTTLIKNGD